MDGAFLQQASLSFFFRILGAGAGFVMSLVITRNLSPVESGFFFLGFAVSSVLATLSTLGLNNAFVRFIGSFSWEQNWSVVNGIFIRGLMASFLVSGLVMTLLIIFSPVIGGLIFNKPELSRILLILAFAIPSITIYMITSFAFQGLHRPVFSVLFQNISCQVLVVLGIMSLSLLGVAINIINVASIFTGSAVVTSILALAFWFSREEASAPSDYSQTSALIASLRPLWLTMVMTMLVQWGGQLIAGIFAPADEVAFFSVAQRTAMLTSFILIAVNLVAAPRFSAIAKRGNMSELRAISIFCSKIMIIIAIPILITMLIFSERIMGLFGAEYGRAAILLQVLVLGQFINVATGSVGFLLNMTGYETDMRNIVFLSGPLALILSFILVPIYGVLGAAISTSIAVASQNILGVYIVKKRLGFNTLNLFK